MPTPASCQHVVLSLKRLLVIESPPAEWQALDLYLFRDEEVVFYVGQSERAITRVWDHILGSFKARSVIGRFVLCNWPASMNFTVELQSSRLDCFAGCGHDLDTAERWLIERYTPCFNLAMNRSPSALPARYLPPTATLQRRLSPSKMIREASYAIRAEDKARWLAELQ